MNLGWWQQILGFLLVGFVAVYSVSCSPATPAATGKSAETPANKATKPAVPATVDRLIGPMVRIRDTTFTVDVADSLEIRAKGLSGRASLPPGAGMLFIFEDTGFHTFWMKGMMFPLDLIWIGEQCTVESIIPRVPPPGPEQSDSDLPRFRPTQPVRYVLEINGGEAAAANIQVGDPVYFVGSLQGRFGC